MCLCNIKHVASPFRESYKTFTEGDPMGNLTGIPHSEITATLEVLEKYGVEREHFKFLRKSEHFAAYVANALTSGLSNYNAAMSGEEEAGMQAVMFFAGNERVLADIAIEGLFDKVRLKAVELISDQRALYDVARNANTFPVANAAMLRLDSWMDLVNLGEYGYVWGEPSAKAILAERSRKMKA